ncbi:hypothetical protein DN826_12600 [Stutzerimonas nosocomialis]|uniref:glycoside hydrolase family 19 protein n=1 Tax=Stutzerimonas nosocomialis TaxID=1056496 RepID=UPI0011092714|nr:hypothetical protein [Stutzerimonas nosocomialis]TLX54788.1 hypothetical protein DN826_12600 [Stutzerimonas nosocomialis]
MAEHKPINWAYPFPSKEVGSNPLQLLTHMAKAKSGYYPTGENGLWHGGVHFDEGTAAVFDQSNVRCIADGEVIAYRIDESYPVSEFTDEIPSIKRAPFSTGFVLVKHTLQPPQPKKVEGDAADEQTPPRLTLYSLYMHLQDWAGYQAKADLPRPAFWEVKSHIVNTQSQGLIVRASANKDSANLSEITKGAEVTVTATEGEYSKLVSLINGTANSPLTADSEGNLPGYISSKFLQARSEPNELGQVVVLGEGIPIKAGELIGHPGIYQNHNGAAHPLIHLEVFSCDDVPGFIARSRAWASRLPDDQKTLLKVYKGASKLIAHRDDFNAENPPKLSDEGSQIGVDLIIPQALLDGLPPANKIQVRAEGSASPSTTHWWRLDGLFADESGSPIDGWLAEQELITTRHSPWEWQDFQCIEETGTPFEKLAYTFNAKGMLSADEQHNYRAQINRADGGLIVALARLYDIVDTDQNGVLTSHEIRAALARPWHAQVLGQLITKYESEWFWNQSKWDELDPLLEEEPGKPNLIWEAEKERIKELSWWSDLTERHGINGDGRAWHVQPLHITSSFNTESNFKFTIDIMKEIYPDLDKNRDGDLLSIANELNNCISLYKLDTPLRRSHFFAQILQETGPQLSIEESFIYKAESLIQIFRFFRNNPKTAKLHGYETRRGIKADGTRMNQADFEAIANGAYGGRTDLGNGDYSTGDGWRYRGRGLKQLTGRYNYEALTTWHNQLLNNWPGDIVDFVENPDLLLTLKYATRSAASFWISNKLYELADKGIRPETVDSITEVINRNTDSYAARRANFERLWKSKTLN